MQISERKVEERIELEAATKEELNQTRKHPIKGEIQIRKCEFKFDCYA